MKNKGRFSYVESQSIENSTKSSHLKKLDDGVEESDSFDVISPDITSNLIKNSQLSSLPKRKGRMEQKEQLNIRIPKDLKRLAAVRAALEGKTIGALVESVLIDYLTKEK